MEQKNYYLQNQYLNIINKQQKHISIHTQKYMYKFQHNRRTSLHNKIPTYNSQPPSQSIVNIFGFIQTQRQPHVSYPIHHQNVINLNVRQFRNSISYTPINRMHAIYNNNLNKQIKISTLCNVPIGIVLCILTKILKYYYQHHLYKYKTYQYFILQNCYITKYAEIKIICQNSNIEKIEENHNNTNTNNDNDNNNNNIQQLKIIQQIVFQLNKISKQEYYADFVKYYQRVSKKMECNWKYMISLIQAYCTCAKLNRQQFTYQQIQQYQYFKYYANVSQYQKGKNKDNNNKDKYMNTNIDTNINKYINKNRLRQSLFKYKTQKDVDIKRTLSSTGTLKPQITNIKTHTDINSSQAFKLVHSQKFIPHINRNPDTSIKNNSIFSYKLSQKQALNSHRKIQCSGLSQNLISNNHRQIQRIYRNPSRSSTLLVTIKQSCISTNFKTSGHHQQQESMQGFFKDNLSLNFNTNHHFSNNSNIKSKANNSIIINNSSYEQVLSQYQSQMDNQNNGHGFNMVTTDQNPNIIEIHQIPQLEYTPRFVNTQQNSFINNNPNIQQQNQKQQSQQSSWLKNNKIIVNNKKCNLEQMFHKQLIQSFVSETMCNQNNLKQCDQEDDQNMVNLKKMARAVVESCIKDSKQIEFVQKIL